NDYLISFPYLFVLYFLSSLTILFLIHRRKIRWKIMLDLKFRIQAAIISIVFISLLLVAAGTIFYNLRESGSRLRSDLDQKMNSISVELDLHLQNETSFYPAMNDWLLPELVKLSNVFQTDINIFGVNGDLVASSRPEIFNRGLVSRKINTQAYYELYENFQTNYFQPEKIGELSYLSAYEPIINNRGEYLGFINLPFFTHQDKYSQEISTFVVAFINLYVLLFLASLVVAVFFANQITLPLVTIRENLRKIELGKRHEHIHYQRDDEIGKLVKEYNKKVDELVVSAELLARSERESAWREMAKQVAHEIKNPLTPMKLNIQHLQRFRGEGKEYTDYVNRISQILINQIDTLSDIATEFSSFAQIPTAIKQVFPVAEQIGKVIELYTLHDNVTISFLKNDCDGVLINADREQLSRALINLIKNGIQAIPENREGKIIISLEKKEQAIIISVEDNGSGIPAELQEKMFSPNFTTKSSGMGLGLAIVKNIAENFNGRVWYETRQQEGTTFYFEIPVYNESPKP
ncbi:MAG TPA: ATP-binding protein, partial [Prolixibacteraceae bacterium]|nr:ATP-binding protein [Prolixibacteraceae bacterium]